MTPRHLVALRGDESALYARYADSLRRITAAHVIAAPEDIDDACAEAWLILLSSQPRRDTIWPWLVTVARRETWRLDRRRRLPDPAAVVEPVAEGADVEALLTARLQLADVRPRPAPASAAADRPARRRPHLPGDRRPHRRLLPHHRPPTRPRPRTTARGRLTSAPNRTTDYGGPSAFKAHRALGR